MAGGGDERRDGPSRGVWKMVYADFTTAMMAFFLVMWLTSTASEAQRDLLADFFNPVSVSREQSGADGILAGRSMDTEGGSTSAYGSETAHMMAAPPVVAEVGDVTNPPFTGVEMQPQGQKDRFADNRQNPSRERLDEIAQALKIALEQELDRKGLRDVILIERRPDSVRVQVSDSYGFLMFETGKAELSPQAAALFERLGRVLRSVPNTVTIAGHTDAAGFSGQGSNWELSSDRAHAARRALIQGGLVPDRIEAVEGRADRDPLLKDNPLDPRNRRITVTVRAQVSPSSELFYAVE